MRICLPLIVAECLVAQAGCGSYFAPNRNLARQVAKSDVVGEWTLAVKSLALLQRDGFVADPARGHTITFNEDGSFRFASVLDDFRGGRYLEVPGTWTLEHDTTGDSNVHKANALRLEYEVPNAGQIRYLNFAEEKGVIRLWNYYGDPDSWEFIEYIRGAHGS